MRMNAYFKKILPNFIIFLISLHVKRLVIKFLLHLNQTMKHKQMYGIQRFFFLSQKLKHYLSKMYVNIHYMYMYRLYKIQASMQASTQ